MVSRAGPRPADGPSRSRRMLTGNVAAAWGARLADVDYVPAFPITPQTEIVEAVAEWIGDGSMPGRFVTVDSEHAMITAAGAAAATGCRVFTATSSQGLLYAMEALYTVAGWRIPFVLVNVSRALASPITLEADHNDILAARDSGCVQIHAETCQEVLDSVLLGYRIAEHPDVQVPVIVNMDGFTLSFTREPVSLPSPEEVSAFLPAFEPREAMFRASRPLSQGVAVLGGPLYSYFRLQADLAVRAALDVHEQAARDFAAATGRRYGPVDAYRLDDADYVLVLAGSLATRVRAVLDQLREEGRRIGLLRLRLVRPFPATAVASALARRKAVAVLDQNLSPGLGGILYQEVAGALAGCGDGPRRLLSFVGGLGGKDVSAGEVRHIADRLEQEPAASCRDGPAGPEMLFTDADWRQAEAALRAAGALDREGRRA